MFEEYSKDYLLNRILQLVPEDDDVSPHSPLYIMSAPIAQGWAWLYQDQNYALDQSFPLSADREYLIRHAETYQISPYPATPSVVEGEFDIEISLGERFSKDQVNFRVIEYLRSENGYYYYSMECEETGEIGNVAPGVIIPIEMIRDLKHSEIKRILVPGEEEEDTETFRERFLASFISKKFCGNISDYMEELAALEGVGRVKILRCRDYTGKINPEWVTIVFTDSLGRKPTEELVLQVQNYFQELDEETHLPSHETSGTGLAAIGQLCWVEGVKEETIDFAFNLTFEAGFNWDNRVALIRKALEERLNELVLTSWGDTVITQKAYRPMDYYIEIKRSDIESLIIDIEGISDSTDMKINDAFQNYNLAWNAIPKLGEVTFHDESEYPDVGDCPYNCPDCACNKHGEICGRCT